MEEGGEDGDAVVSGSERESVAGDQPGMENRLFG